MYYIDEVVRIAEEVREQLDRELFQGDSTGFCVTASKALTERLAKAGIHVSKADGEMPCGHAHTFCILAYQGEAYIVDITADQFNGLGTYTYAPVIVEKVADVWEAYPSYVRRLSGVYHYDDEESIEHKPVFVIRLSKVQALCAEVYVAADTDTEAEKIWKDLEAQGHPDAFPDEWEDDPRVDIGSPIEIMSIWGPVSIPIGTRVARA